MRDAPRAVYTRIHTTDDDFRRLLGDYLDAPSDPNPDRVDVDIVWIEGNPKVGALHIELDHGVSKEEVEEVLLRMPPMVQAKRSPQHRERTLFWGATREDRWLFVVCEDVMEASRRKLTVITAYEPDDGESYWRKYG